MERTDGRMTARSFRASLNAMTATDAKRRGAAMHSRPPRYDDTMATAHDARRGEQAGGAVDTEMKSVDEGKQAEANRSVPSPLSRDEDRSGSQDAASGTSQSFERIRAKLRATLGGDIYASWFQSLRFEGVEGPVVRHSVPTQFLKSWIASRYAATLLKLWKEEDEAIQHVEIVLRNAARPKRNGPDAAASAGAAGGAAASASARSKSVPKRPASAKADAASRTDNAAAGGVLPAAAAEGRRSSVIGSPLDPRFRFDSFVEGAPNRVALAAARSVAETDGGSVRFNPLFLHAGVGYGKTHLLQAIAAQAAQREPGARIVYLTAEYFMWRFATALRDNDALSLKEQLRGIDLLIIDDMQFLQGKTIQHEFCHLLNSLLDSARQVVVAADRPAQELESLEERVRSRLNGGVMLQIGAPDFAMRRSMLETRLQNARREDPDIAISDAVMNHVAEVVAGSGRELEGAFNQLLFRQSFESELTVDQVDEFLGHIYRSGEPRRVRIEDIQRIVARHYNVSKTELLSNRRTRTIVKPRQIAMYLSKQMTMRSLPEIGRRFGGRDHTTVLHAVRKIEGLIETDHMLAQEVELLKRLINEQA